MPPTAILSEERVHDSSEDESSSSEEETTAKPTTNGASKSTLVQVSNTPDSKSDESDDQSDAESDDSSTSKTSTSSKSSSASSAGSKRKTSARSKKIFEPPTKRAKTSSNEKVRRIEASRYVPPQGYAAVTYSASGSSARSSAIFNRLDGKQVWHITAPATVPMSTIQSIDLQSALKGGPIVEDKGTSYTMSPADVDGAALLIPNNMSAEYAPASTSVTRAFHIRELAIAPKDQTETTDDEAGPVTNVDNSETGSPIFFATETGHKKSPRNQPENLKARYVPYGVPFDKSQIIVRPMTTANKDRTVTKPVCDLSEALDESEGSESKPEAPIPTKSAKKLGKQRNTSDEMDVDTERTPAKPLFVQSTPRSAAKSAGKKKSPNAMDVAVAETPGSMMKGMQMSASTVGSDSLSTARTKKKKDKSKKAAA